MKVFLYIFFGVLHIACGLDLPNYLTKCSASDPKLNECFKESGNKGLADVLKGDRKYKVLKLDPLNLTKIDLNSGGTFNMVLNDAVIKNLISTKILKANVDMKNNHWEFDVSIDPMIVEAQYEINGRVLVLPITGNGFCKIVLEKGIYNYVVDLKIIEKNGEEHLVIDKSNIEAKIDHVIFRFDNLFNGDKRLGDQMNKFINENWEEFLKELYPAMVKTMIAVVDSTLGGYLNAVPKNKVFDP